MNTKAIIEKKESGNVVGYKALVVEGNVSHTKIETMVRQSFGSGTVVSSGPSRITPGQYDIDLDGTETLIAAE